MKRYIKLAVIAAVALFGGVITFNGWTTSAQTQVVTAGAKYKNIKVLNDMPADQLGRVMNLWAASLGVDCDFCHVTTDFSKDDKRAKGTAREMVKMVQAINKDNFNSRPRITCNSCHNGHMEPSPVPNLNPVAETPRPEQPKDKPAVDQILDKYYVALGGKDKVNKVTSRVVTATRTEKDGKETEQETVYYADGKYAMKTVYPQTTVTEAWDGSTAWKAGKQPIPIRVDEQEQIKREAAV
ncbi:MAG: c-type cytochrome, partial [Acidobacteria bacterium]|nr:c-type cytochrome [Acidobacteriota bacterium]